MFMRFMSYVHRQTNKKLSDCDDAENNTALASEVSKNYTKLHEHKHNQLVQYRVRYRQVYAV